MSQQALSRGVLRLTQQRHILQTAAASAQWSRLLSDKASDGEGEAGSNGGLLQRIWKGPKGLKSKEDSTSTSADNALIVSGPERKHHKVFVVELSRKPLFPGIYTPVMINKNEPLIKEIAEAKKQGAQAYIGAFLKRPEQQQKEHASSQQGQQLLEADLPGTQDAASHLHDVGTFAQVHTVVAGEHSDSAQLLLLGHRRVRKLSVISEEPLKVHIEHLRDEQYNNDDILKATSMEIVNTMRDLLQLNPLYGEQFRTLLSLTGSIDLQDMSRLVDAAASLTSADEGALQAVLEQLNVPERARMVLTLLKKEVELCKLQADIREQVEGKIMKEQRRMLLMEQLKSIKKELGLEKDDKSALLQRFQARWDEKKAKAPPEVAKAVQDELEKLGGLEPVSPEFNVTRTYLEWLIGLPWGTYTEEVFDLARAKQVLDDDHYGLDDVKDRIFELIAVSKLRGGAQGKILCLVGPPGVGKTSIGRSIAHALNRKYYRFSVGGLYDVAEIKGHRRTYVGAMPGKMVQCLKSTQSSNPLVLIDEIDKLGRGHSGDPASALLELLDPEQNSGFLDHYLDMPIDVSKVLFVCTANQLDTIPGPLLDRMEVIRLSGYAAGEKVAIARRYLEVQAASDAGVPRGACVLSDEALDSLINEYCREAGVRNLKKHMEKIYRKVALQLVKQGVTLPPPQAKDTAQPQGQGQEKEREQQQGVKQQAQQQQQQGSEKAQPAREGGEAAAVEQAEAPQPYSGPVMEVGKDRLKDYVGKPPFAKDKFYEHMPAGVVMGLAWTPMGGATLYVEVAKVSGSEAKGSVTITGQLGDVFKESVTIAHTYARNFLAAHDPGNVFFSSTPMHVHVPAGATPKDGPSAGCTLVTALLSLALDKPVIPDLAMTGEVTLNGCVLPIGGVKEKVLAARRSGVKTLVFPEGNRHEYEELADDLKQGLNPHFVKSYEEVYKLAFNEQ